MKYLSYEEYKSLSQEEQKEYKNKILEEIRNYHEETLKDLNVDKKDFQMKTPFFYKGKYVVGIFPSEINRQDGFYFELVNREFHPILFDDERKIYKMPYTPNYKEKYTINEKGTYVVPIDDLISINAKSIAISGKSAILESFFTEEDAPFLEMTIRDFYAILKERPLSNKKWLNDLINLYKK